MIRRVWALCAAVLVFFIVNSIKADELTINLETDFYKIQKTTDGFHEIKMDDFGNLLLPGKPMLPAKSYLIALPPGAEINSVHVEATSKVKIQGSYKIMPAQLMLPMDHQENLVKEAKAIYQENVNSSYLSDEFYPGKCGWSEGKGAWGKYEFVRITFAPFSFQANSGTLIFSPQAVAVIDYSVPSNSLQGLNSIDQAVLKNKSDNRASKIFYNYNSIKNWYPLTSIVNNLSASYNYIVITTDDLQKAVSPLVVWKTSLGYSANVVTIGWISSEYSGDDLPQQIRNF